jgi:hypothetical protein
MNHIVEMGEKEFGEAGELFGCGRLFARRKIRIDYE